MSPKTGLFLLVLFFPIVAFAQFSDTTPPQLADFYFSPTTIDTTSGPQTVTVTMRLTDDLSGSAGGCFSFTSPSRTQFQYVCATNVVSGTPLDGLYQGNVTFPQFTESGVWHADSLYLYDLAGNVANLTALGFPTALTVTSNPDTAPPLVTSVTLTPSSVDATSGATIVIVKLAIQDDVSGVDMVGIGPFWPVTMASPSGQQTQIVDNAAFTLVAGDDLNGTWQAAFPIPQFSEGGTWVVQNIFVMDKAGNNAGYSTAYLQQHGIPLATLDVSCTNQDLIPPQLLSLSFKPPFIDVSLQPQTVTVDLTASDNLSGVDMSPDTPRVSYLYGVQLESPSGAQHVYAGPFPMLQLIIGTPLSGVWEGSAFFPRYAEAGTWRVRMVQIKDTVRNVKSYATADLVAVTGIPTELTVIQPSRITDGTIWGPAEGTVTDSTFGSRAELIAPRNVLSKTTDVAIDVLTSPLAIPSPTGYSAAGTYYVNIELTPTPSFPLPPPGVTLVLPLVNPLIPGSPIDLFRVYTATGLLVPALDTSGLPVTGTVDAGGLSATFMHVAHLSTFAGFVPNRITIAIDIKPGNSLPTINPNSSGTTPVALLGSATFDPVTMVNRSSLTFGHSGNEASLSSCAPNGEDVNRDGRLDLVCHFVTKKTGFLSGDTKGVLHGRTTTGIAIEGSDAIRVK
jgi:hypothetical protein